MVTDTTRSFGMRGWVLAASLLVNCGLAVALMMPGNDDQSVAMSAAPATSSAADEAKDSAGVAKAEDFDSLIDVIIEATGKKDSFADDSSPTEVRPFPGDLSKVISQTQEVHEQSSGDAGERTKMMVEPKIIVTPEGEFPKLTGDLDVPVRQNSFGLSVPSEGKGQDDNHRKDDAGFKPAPGNIGLEGLINEAQPAPPGTGEIQLGRLPATEAPVVYPDAEVWEDLSRRRTKYAAKDKKSNGVPASDRQAGLSIRDGASVPPNAAGTVVYSVQPADDFTRLAEGEEWQLGVQVARPRSGPESFDAYDPWLTYLGDARAKFEAGGQWGFQSGGHQWPRGRGEQWHGSPDGEGIGPGASGDQYDRIHENPFIPAIGGEAISTFSIDVDTASYANVRQMLMNSQTPPADAVRLEEFVNYFDYDYEGPSTDAEAPFAAHVETAGCPWKPAHRLVRIAIKGREVEAEKRPLSNLVFLVDVSGSMNNPDKLPLVKHGLKQVAAQLGENDRVAIVVYASQEGLALPSTPGTERETILAALDNLQSGGSTAGGAGITLAYQIAEDNFIQGGTNRVILCTDGDFNVGTTSTAELERLVEQKAKDTKVFLSAIGFGRGNLNDAMMEKITGIGNGNYYYADGEQEAERVFVKGMTGMLVTIAKDVKIQVEFNPQQVAGYRLLGYENRMLEIQDFNDDKKDAGEIGAGHTVTCLYEIVPAGEPLEAADIDEFKYQRPAGLTDKADSAELLTLKMRYKQPDEETSSKLEWPVVDSGQSFGEATTDMQFASAVASFGMLLRGSQYAGDSNYDAVLEIADSTKGDDPEGERAEFLAIVRAAKRLVSASESTDQQTSESEE